MKRSAILASCTIAIGVTSCNQRQHPTGQQQPAQPYAIQHDVLGETSESYIKNNPTCKPKPDEIDSAESCLVLNSTYAGMPILFRTASFYQGRLYHVFLSAPTSKCREFELFNSLVQKFGEPKKTELLNGKEVTPYHGDGSEYEFWQNGVSAISFQELLDPRLDACSTEFYLDNVDENVEKLKKKRTEELKKKDM